MANESQAGFFDPLMDQTTGRLTTIVPVVRYNKQGQLEIRLRGYGDNQSNDGEGCPIVIEVVDGRLSMKVWSNINREDPTHVIDLEWAKESNRKG